MLQNKIIGVIGPKGSGKTWTVAQYILTLERSAVFDMVHEAGYLNERSQIFVGRPKEFAASLMQEQFNSVYRPTIFKIEGDRVICPMFNGIVKCCYLRGNLTLIIDEAHLLCNAHSCPPMLMTANLIGRHRSMSIVYVAQSFSAVNRPLTRNTDEFWFWRIIEPGDLDGIRDRCGRDTALRVEQLHKLERGSNGEVIPGQMVKWDIWNGLYYDGAPKP